MDKNLKYELTEEFTLINGKKLFRIRALKDLPYVKKGDLGGFIEKESNLSQEDNCWIYDNARIFGNAYVYDNALVYDNAQVFGGAWIYNNAQVFGNAQVYGDAIISGNAVIYENTQVYGNAQVSGNSWIYGGVWPMSPFYFCLSKNSITSCSYTHIKIGCKVNTIEDWKDLGEEIGKKYGYSDEDIELYREALLFAEKYIELVKKEANNG